MRKSSKGNPYHDERGRFTTSDGCKIRSERTKEEYDKRSQERQSPFNGDVNEGLRVMENDGKYHAQVVRHIGSEVTVRNLAGEPMRGKIIEEDKDVLGDTYYRVEYRTFSGKTETMLIGDDVLDDWMSAEDIQKDRAEADKLRIRNAHKYAKAEVLFLNRDTRCHASIVDKLPEKTYRFTSGYSEIGRYDYKGKTYKVFRDKSDMGQFAYFAIEDKGD